MIQGNLYRIAGTYVAAPSLTAALDLWQQRNGGRAQEPGSCELVARSGEWVGAPEARG